jgi:NitT/TauT family transport system permease protein
LPASLPMILTGFRQGIGTCWFVIIAAEMLPGSDSGIGYLLMYAADLCAMDVVIVVMVIIGGIGALLNLVMRSAMHAFIRWYGKEI